MPLTEQSSLDQALARIIGSPSASASAPYASIQTPINYETGAFGPVASTDIAVGAVQPVTAPPPIPIATTVVPTPVAPVSTPVVAAPSPAIQQAAPSVAQQSAPTSTAAAAAPKMQASFTPGGGRTVSLSQGAYDSVVAPTSSTAPAAPKAPVNPGARAPWQQSQQYWKDLDAYRKAGGK